MSSTKTGCGLVVFAVLAALGGSAAVAQNLDQDKPAPKIFAESCATCHRSARGLAKGRFSLTLYLFLQDHYTSNSTSAWALTSYLESVDSAKRSPSRAAAKPPAAAAGSSRSSLRPPMPVPTR
jgi:mono/diheme cytochrome c family protein